MPPRGKRNRGAQQDANLEVGIRNALPTISLTAQRRFGMGGPSVDQDDYRHQVEDDSASSSSRVSIGHALAEDNDGASNDSPTDANESKVVDADSVNSDLAFLGKVAASRLGDSAMSVRQRLVEKQGAKDQFCDDTGFLSFAAPRSAESLDGDIDSSSDGGRGSESEASGLGDDDGTAAQALNPVVDRDTERADRAAARAAAELSESTSDEDSSEKADSPVSSPVNGTETFEGEVEDEYTAAAQVASAAAPNLHRQTLHGVTMQSKTSFGFATTTIVALSNPLTIRAPCAVWAISGVSTVGGFVIQPGTRSQWAWVDAYNTKQHQDEFVVVAPLQQKKFTARRKAADADAKYDAAVATLESTLGPVDWPWVAKVTNEWKQRLGSLPTTVLLVERPKEIDTSKAAHKRARFGVQDAAAAQNAETPSCIAKRVAPFASLPLFADVVPPMLKAIPNTIATIVVGQQGVGKSTVARELANAFISRFGGCLFLDLDPGQGELTPPGSLALALLTLPLMAVSPVAPPQSLLKPNINVANAEATEPSRVLQCHYIGSTVVRDPCVASRAIVALCQAAKSAATERNLPVVINTHGWVHGTGRRCTVEAIQRLRPSHVVHLRTEEDDDWVGEAAAVTGRGSLADPASGLSAATISNCGSVAKVIFAKLLNPAAQDGRDAKKAPPPLQFELLRMKVRQQHVKVANARIAMRFEKWEEYFACHHAAFSAPYDVPGRTSVGDRGALARRASRLRVPLHRVSLLSTELEDVGPAQQVSFEVVKNLMIDALVAVAVAAFDEEKPSLGAVSHVTCCRGAPSVVGFGLVVALEGQTLDDAVVVLRSPVSGVAAREAGSNALILGFQQLRLKGD